MQYRLKSKPNYFGRWKTIIAFVLFFILAGFSFLFPNATRNVADTVSKPLWFVENAFLGTVSSVRNFFTFKSTLLAQNMSLQNQVASLELKQIDYDAILSENQSLKNQTGIAGNRITSRILSKPPQSPYDTLVIDTGADDGVVLGDKVYLSDTVIVGLVTATTPHTSLVTLFSSSGETQSATDSRTGGTLVLEGQGGANFSAQVPKETDILWGDTFLYPAKSASVLGNVYYVDSNSQSSFKTIYVRIPVNIFQSQWVFVQKGQ